MGALDEVVEALRALKAWAGKPENVEAAQRAYYHRAKMNGAARTGMYAPEMEKEAVAA